MASAAWANAGGGVTRTEPSAQKRAKKGLRIERITTPGQNGFCQCLKIIASKSDTMMTVRGGDYLPLSVHRREIFAGLIRIHVLLHAAHEPLFGLAMMEELNHHGYRVGPGTLYPLLHGMERNGLLVSQLMNVGGRRRRAYKLTKSGKRALEQARTKVDELYEELHEEHPRRVSHLNERESQASKGRV